MMLARVIGTVVCTRKEESLTGMKLLLIQPLSALRQPFGKPLVAWASTPPCSTRWAPA